MKNTLFMLLATTALCGSLTLGQPPQTPPPSAAQQPTDVRVVITGDGGAQPKLGIAGFVALSSDAETVAAARTIGDVLFDDINYEREYYMIAKDAIATIPKPASLDQVPIDRWKELNADGVIVGTVQKGPAGISTAARWPTRAATRIRSRTRSSSSSSACTALPAPSSPSRRTGPPS